MMNYLWSGMLLLGIMWGAFHGGLNQVTMGILDGAKDGVSLGLALLGVLAFWSGILEIAQASGLVDWLAGKLRPVMKFLFPNLDPGHPAVKYMSLNMIANCLGLGSAATPAGLAAFKELEKLEEERRGRERRERERRKKDGQEKEGQEKKISAQSKGTASNEMCTFLILNISSLQLIPVNIIAYRSQYGSSNPAAIVGPAIAATMASTLAAVVFCKVMDR
ncbi:MAG: nucleoside recognition protein [Lachnospiraceae bacterium]|nr:nucleoside recognition protein [Lachnospiraceae bacterium]